MTKLTPPPDPSQEKKMSFVAFDHKDYSRKYYEQNKEKILLYQKQYYHSKRKQKKKPIFDSTPPAIALVWHRSDA